MNSSVALVGLLLLVASQSQSFGQNGMNMAPIIPVRAWIASDGPYKEVETRIKKEYAQGKSLETIAQEYQFLAKANPKNPVVQFAWVYAERGAVWIKSSEGSMPRSLIDTLAKSDPGNVREYTRYRFCLTDETDLVLPLQNTELIGKRLLASDPMDHWVRLSLINMLCAAPGGTKKALPYAQDWVKIEPTNPKAHSSLAQVYFNQWEESGRRSKSLGLKAISEYQTYLRLAPANDGFRTHAQSFIMHIQQGQV